MNQTFPDTNIVFMCGHRKCGTTMSLNLFDHHSQLCVYPMDLTFLYAYFPQFVKENKDVDTLRARIKTLSTDRLRDGNYLEKAQIDEMESSIFLKLTSEDDFLDVSNVINTVLESYKQVVCTDKKGYKWTFVKETSIEIYAQQVREWFPHARFIQILRDPRDNYAALKAGVGKYYGKFGEDEMVTMFSLINRLGTGMRMGRLNHGMFGDDDYRLVKFEDIVSRPKEVMKDMASWLDISFEDTLLIPTKSGQPTFGNNYDGKKFSGISKAHAGAWKERINDEEAKIIEFYLGDLMEDYGYERAFSVKDCMEAATDFYKWVNYRYFYFDAFKK